MWQKEVLKELAVDTLAGPIEARIQAELDSNPALQSQEEVKDRLWVLGLFELFHSPQLLDKKVEAWKAQSSQAIQYFVSFYEQLPHKLIAEHYDLIKQAAAAFHKATRIDNEYGFQDLLSVGQEALYLAARKHYLNPKEPFKNFAWNLLRQKMKEEQQQKHPIPGRLRQKLRSLEIIREECRYLRQTIDRDELMKRLAINAAQLDELLSLEAVWGYGADFETDVVLEELEKPDQAPTALMSLIAKEDRALVEAAVAKLPNRSRLIIREIYFGDKSLRELADELGVSINSLKKAHKKALLDLRDGLSSF